MKFILFFQDVAKKSFQTLESVLRIFLLSKFYVKLPHSDQKECVILANGPSLKNDIKKHSEFLKDKVLFCVNHFPTTELFEKLKPANFVTAVPELWLEDVAPIYIKQREDLIESFLNKVTWPVNIFLPFESRKKVNWKALLSKNRHIKIVYFNNTPIEGGRRFSHTCFRKNFGMPRPHNVLIPSLMLSINMGYKKIYLLGVDHSWLPEISVNGQNDVLIHQKHYYDQNTSKSLPMDIKGKGKRNLGQVLHKFMLTFSGYYTIREYAESRSVTIFNCTKNSFIDAFERLDLD